MDITRILQKRETFHVQIRKQHLETIFKIKRQQGLLLKKSQHSPNEQLKLIQENYENQDYQKLSNILQEYSDEFLINLNIFLTQESDLINMTQFLTHIYKQENALVFYKILKLRDNSPYCFDCLNQTLVIMINFTFLSGFRIGNYLLDQGLQGILLNDILRNLNLNLELNKCQIAFLNICQVLINLILDLEYNDQQRLKEAILNSNLIKIWYSMFQQGMDNNQHFFLLCHLLFTGQNNYPSSKFIEISQICINIINQQCCQEETYEQALKLLIKLSELRASDIQKLSKVFWQRILQINKNPIEYTTLFINFLNNSQDIQQELINIGLIQNLVNHLNNQQLDIQLIHNILILFNRLLYQQCPQLIETCLNVLIPYLNLNILEKIQDQSDILQEYMLIFLNLLQNQKLSDEHYETLIFNLNFIGIITQILQKNKLCLKWFPYLLNIFEKLKLGQKRCIYYKMKENQMIQFINYIRLSQQHKNDEIIEIISQIIESWEQEFKEQC